MKLVNKSPPEYDAVGGVVGALIEPPVLGAAVGGVVGAALSAVVDNVYP